MEILICKREHKDLNVMEGDMYVIHKPVDVNETPTWIPSMDVFDGMPIELTHSNGETSSRRYWSARPVNDSDPDTIYSFNMNWLEPICIGEELDILEDVDFFSI